MWQQKQINLLSCGWGKYMIIEHLNIFLQNIQKNQLLTDIILENYKNFDVIFI